MPKEEQKKKNDFLVKEKDLSKASKELVFKVPVAKFDEFYKQSLRDLGKDLKVAGFRKGKVPDDVVEKELTPERILYNAGDLAIRKVYVDAIVSKNIPAIGEPKIELK